MLPLLPSNMQAWLGNLKLHASGFLSNLVVCTLKSDVYRQFHASGHRQVRFESDIVGLWRCWLRL